MKMNAEQKAVFATMTAEQRAAYDKLPNDTMKAQALKTNAEKAASIAAKAKDADPKAPKVPKVSAADNRPITLIVDKNPKREGSAAHARFALYVTGMTVDAYIATCKEKLGKSQPGAARDARADISWDTKHKYITVPEATKAA
jgi:hypothetical protein